MFCGTAESDVRERLENEQNRGEHVIYLGNLTNLPETVIPYVNVVVLASRTEGMPMIILESMAMGKPMITTPVGGIPELI